MTSELPQYCASDIVAATSASTVASDTVVRGVSIDTRSITQGALYVAIRGDRFDGHDFVQDAILKGAAMVLVDHLCDGVEPSKQIIVQDTLQGLQAFATWRRTQGELRVIGITGSVGKTSTKEMMKYALSSQCRVHATSGNLNNHIGVPLTLLNTPHDTDILVLEMGMNHAGEIRLLSRMSTPDAAIITTVDVAHLEFFENVEGIARAKSEIMEGMKLNAPMILPRDNPHYPLLRGVANDKALHAITFGEHHEADYVLRSVAVYQQSTHAEMVVKDLLMQLHLCSIGAHHAMNAVAVLACVDALGFDLAKSAVSLQKYHDTSGRGASETIGWKGGDITLIDETYNASPASIRSASQRLRAIAGDRRRLVILGDMLELGDESDRIHAALADDLITHQFHAIYTVGKHMRALARALPESLSGGHYEDNASLSAQLVNDMKDGDMLLFKGSRGSRVEEVIAYLKENS